jgi:hypothetical protein
MTIYYSPSRKSFLDDKLSYKNLPKDLIAVDEITHKTLVREAYKHNKEIVVVDGSLKLKDKQTVEVELTWDRIRDRRKKLLAECDYTQLPDYPSIKKSEWAAYRQALRDIPQNYTKVSDIVWPVKPN